MRGRALGGVPDAVNGRDRVRAIAEHEAAHAVAGWALGATISSMVIRSDGTGLTMAQGYLSDAETAIYSAAGDLWDAEFSAHDYVDGACFDLRYQVSMIGERGIWQARRTARRILTERRRDVLDLAARLHRERQLVFA